MALKKIAVLISGGGSNLQSVIDNIHGKYGNIEIVISDEDDAYGLTRAEKAGIKNAVIRNKDYDTREKFSAALVSEIKKHNTDLVVLAGFMKILPENFIREYKNRIINIHPSLIPAFCGKGYYGLRVHKAVIEYGVKVTGATVHFVDEGADTGPVIIQDTTFVKYEDTPEILQKRVLEVEHKLLPEAVKLFCEDKLEVIGRRVKIKS